MEDDPVFNSILKISGRIPGSMIPLMGVCKHKTDAGEDPLGFLKTLEKQGKEVTWVYDTCELLELQLAPTPGRDGPPRDAIEVPGGGLWLIKKEAAERLVDALLKDCEDSK